jgi:hypothetical protein
MEGNKKGPKGWGILLIDKPPYPLPQFLIFFVNNYLMFFLWPPTRTLGTLTCDYSCPSYIIK